MSTHTTTTALAPTHRLVCTRYHTHTYSASLSLMAAEGVQLPSTSDEPDTYNDCDAGTSGA